MRIACLVLAALTVTALSGCYASGAKHGEIAAKIPPIPAGKGRMYVYRDTSFPAANWHFEVRVGSELLGLFKRGAFSFIDVEPGRHMVKLEMPNFYQEKGVRVQAGETAYVRIYPYPPPEMKTTSREEAEEVMRKCVYVGFAEGLRPDLAPKE